MASARLNRAIESVPNFSSGRDAQLLEGLAQAVQGYAGVRLLDRSADRDHNRSVFTIAGAPEAVVEAVFAAVRVAVSRIDLNLHDGVHPRIGAADVIPFVPLANITMEECVEIARKFGERLWRERFARDPRVERMRFDVAAVELLPGGGERIEIVRAAF